MVYLRGQVEAHAGHRGAELLLGDLAVAVGVPLPEEVDHAGRVLDERLLELGLGLGAQVRLGFGL